MSSEFYGKVAEAVFKEEHEYTNDKIPRNFWGYHLVISTSGSPENIIMNLDMVEKFVLDTVDKLKMQPVGKPISRFFNDGDGKGCSVIQLLTTSHVSCHTDGTDGSGNSAFIDIFSCDYYDPEKLIPFVKQTFAPKKISYIFLLRNPGIVKVLKNV